MKKVAKFIQSDNLSNRLGLMKSVLWNIEFVNDKLLHPLNTLIKQDIDDIDEMIVLERYIAQILRAFPTFEKDLKNLKDSLKMKIENIG